MNEPTRPQAGVEEDDGGEFREEIETRFTYHAPKDDQVPRYNSLRKMGKDLAHAIVTATPPSREQSLALTHLEQTIFYANAAIARREGGDR